MILKQPNYPKRPNYLKMYQLFDVDKKVIKFRKFCEKMLKVAGSCGKLKKLLKVAENGKSCGTATILCPWLI